LSSNCRYCSQIINNWDNYTNRLSNLVVVGDYILLNNTPMRELNVRKYTGWFPNFILYNESDDIFDTNVVPVAVFNGTIGEVIIKGKRLFITRVEDQDALDHTPDNLYSWISEYTRTNVIDLPKRNTNKSNGCGVVLVTRRS